MDFGEESEVEVSSRDGEGEFSVFRIFLKKRCIRLATPVLNTIKQHATMCDKCCMFYEMLWSFGRGLNKCCTIQLFFCFSGCCMMLYWFGHPMQLCCTLLYSRLKKCCVVLYKCCNSVQQTRCCTRLAWAF